LTNSDTNQDNFWGQPYGVQTLGYIEADLNNHCEPNPPTTPSYLDNLAWRLDVVYLMQVLYGN
jgi:hypothetical protein